MDSYINGKKIGEVFIGGKKVKALYKGGLKVYEYKLIDDIPTAKTLIIDIRGSYKYTSIAEISLYDDKGEKWTIKDDEIRVRTEYSSDYGKHQLIDGDTSSEWYSAKWETSNRIAISTKEARTLSKISIKCITTAYRPSKLHIYLSDEDLNAISLELGNSVSSVYEIYDGVNYTDDFNYNLSDIYSVKN